MTALPQYDLTSTPPAARSGRVRPTSGCRSRRPASRQRRAPAAERVLASGWVTTGPEVAAFEASSRRSSAPSTRSRSPRAPPAIELALRALRPAAGRAGAQLHDHVLRRRARHRARRARPGAGRRRPGDRDADAGDRRPRAVDAARRRRRDGGPALRRRPGPGAELAAAAGLPLRPGRRGRRPRARAPGPATARSGSRSRADLLQLLRDQEPADRRGRHGHHRRPGAGRRASAAARLHGMSPRRLAALPARRRAGGTTSTRTGLKANMTDLQAAHRAGPAGRARRLAAAPCRARRPVRRALARRARAPLPPRPGDRPARLAPVRRPGRARRPASPGTSSSRSWPSAASAPRCTSSRCTTCTYFRGHARAAGAAARRRPGLRPARCRFPCTRL